MKNNKKRYTKPRVEKINLDKNISIQMESPPGDPVIKNKRDSGDFSPFKQSRNHIIKI